MNINGRLYGKYEGWNVAIENDFQLNGWRLRARGPASDQPMVRFRFDESEESVWLPEEVVMALADAFGDPDNRYQRRVKELEGDLKRAYEHMAILANAIAGRIPANEVAA